MSAHIHSRQDLKAFLNYEKALYHAKHADIGFLPHLAERKILWRFICLLRFEEYHLNAHHKLMSGIFHFRRVSMSRRYSLNLGPNIVDKGFLLFHLGPILINGLADIGQNFACNVNTAIIAGGRDDGVPQIGNNVMLGYGSVLCGSISVADGVAVGACSFVNRNVTEPNICVAGSPAKKISSNGSSTWGGMKVFEKLADKK